jgi:ATP synthase subunit 6
MILYSPLEQFQIFPLVAGFHYNFSFTNASLIIVFSLSSFLLFQSLILGKNKGYIVSSRIQILIEGTYSIVVSIVEDNLGKRGLIYFPFIFVVCLYVLLSNVLGLVPYSFTTTSHLIVTLALALSVFGAVVILSVQLHKIHAFSHFLPPGTSLPLAFLLVPIEIVSFIFKPLSLAVRLFANMIAGHTLLKVIGGFSWTIIKKGGLIFIAHFIPLLVLVLLIGLELGVALIQTYVFTILICIYFREGINLH